MCAKTSAKLLSWIGKSTRGEKNSIEEVATAPVNTRAAAVMRTQVAAVGRHSRNKRNSGDCIRILPNPQVPARKYHQADKMAVSHSTVVRRVPSTRTIEPSVE